MSDIRHQMADERKRQMGYEDLKVYEKSYKVLRVNQDRVVISSDGVNVTAAVKASNLKKI